MTYMTLARPVSPMRPGMLHAPRATAPIHNRRSVRRPSAPPRVNILHANTSPRVSILYANTSGAAMARQCAPWVYWGPPQHTAAHYHHARASPGGSSRILRELRLVVRLVAGGLGSLE